MDELRNVENTLQGKSNSASNLYRKTVRRRAEIVFLRQEIVAHFVAEIGQRDDSGSRASSRTRQCAV